MKPITETLKEIQAATKEEFEAFSSKLRAAANNDLVDAKWEVIYDEMGHDIIIQGKVAVKSPKDVILQIWLKDLNPGIWIPEYRPWVASVVEFEPQQAVKNAIVALLDSKWRDEDVNAVYRAELWGYVERNGEIEQFYFDQEFTFPG